MALVVCQTVRRRFEGDSPYADDPGYRRYVADLVAPYGLPLDRNVHGGQSYGEMGAALIEELAPDGVRVLVLAFAVPDVRPGRATASYLSHVCPGGPFAFAVCDQGTAAGFTALRLIEEYVRDGGRGLLLVAEQPVLPYPATGLPDRATGVGVLVEGSGRVRQYSGVPAEDVAALLDKESGPVVRGDGLTDVWWRLADLPSGPAVLAGYEADFGYLSLAEVTLP